MARTNKKDLQPTIAPELHEAWQKLRRTGDPEELAKLAGKSRPVIDKALKYGFVRDKELVTLITKFYNDRLAAESKAGDKLLKQMV